jgi:hypothetical protein
MVANLSEKAAAIHGGGIPPKTGARQFQDIPKSTTTSPEKSVKTLA